MAGIKAERDLLEPVALDVKDAADEFFVAADVPGFDAKDLHVHINGSRLVIEGQREITEERKEKESSIHSERRSRIYRMIDLPAPVLAVQAQAVLKNGVLELKLPKAEKPKQIEVTAA